MKKSSTDTSDVIASEEFLWAESGLSRCHAYILPAVLKSLASCRAQRVLDLGCGNGALTAELARKGYSVVGVDSSTTGLEIARTAYRDCQYLHASVEAPLPSELRKRFDVVLAVELIEHLMLPRAVFARAHEALTHSGSLLITTPYHGYWKNLAIAVVGGYDKHWHPLRDYGHVKFFSKNSLCQLFKEQKFAVDEVAMLGRIPPFAKSLLVRGRKVADT